MERNSVGAVSGTIPFAALSTLRNIRLGFAAMALLLDQLAIGEFEQLGLASACGRAI